jgi:Flp pilus assembly protein protease CpaA
MDQLPISALVFAAGLLSIAVVTDVRSRRVHNLVTLPLILFGLLYHTAQTGIPGLLQSVAAVVMAVSLLLVPYLLGGMGAGDMKLLAGIAAWALLSDLIWIFSIAGLLAGVWSLAVWLKGQLSGTPEDLSATGKLTEGRPRWQLIPFALLLVVGAVTRFCMLS